MSLEVEKVAKYRDVERLQVLVDLFKSKYGHDPAVIIRVPGRVNLIGEHIDYCGYAVHPMAIDQDILVAVSKSDEARLVFSNIDSRYDEVSLDLTQSRGKIEVTRDSSKWWNYILCGIKGVVEEIVPEKLGAQAQPVGLRCLFDGTIPPSAGLSSSSALVVSSALMALWSHDLLNGISKSEIASLCARSERYIGTQGGGMDQAIEVLACQGKAKLIEFNPLKSTDVQLPEGATFVIANSLAEKNKAAGPEFNTRVVETRVAAKLIAKELGLDNWKDIRKLKEVHSDLQYLLEFAKNNLHEGTYNRDEICRFFGINDEEFSNLCLTENTKGVQEFKLRDRALHVFSEADRVYQFKAICDESVGSSSSEKVDALSRLGGLMFDSHKSCSDLYQCSHEKLDQLVDLSRKHGALGARLTGAGWGGCIVALVPSNLLSSFLEGLYNDYFKDLSTAEGKSRSEYLFPTKPGSGASVYSMGA